MLSSSSSVSNRGGMHLVAWSLERRLIIFWYGLPMSGALQHHACRHCWLRLLLTVARFGLVRFGSGFGTAGGSGAVGPPVMLGAHRTCTPRFLLQKVYCVLSEGAHQCGWWTAAASACLVLGGGFFLASSVDAIIEHLPR